MKLTSKLSDVVRRSEHLLSERGRAVTALAKAQLDFRAALAKHAAAEHKLELAVGRAAVDEGADPATERAAVAEALQAVSAVGERVSGLRAMLQQDSQIQVALDELSPLLVVFGEDLAADFLPEYEKAAKIWSGVLAKQQALESLLGITITVPGLPPTTHVIPSDLTRPAAAGNGLRGALDCIAQQRREVEIWHRRRHDAHPTAARYKVLKNFVAGTKSFTAGQIIAGAEIEPGEAQIYVERRSLTPLMS